MKPLKIDHTFSCVKDWDEMAGESANRHCAQCDRNVVNLSRYTEAVAYQKALELAQTESGEFCAVFECVGDKIIFQPEPVHRSMKSSVAAAALTLPLLFGCEDSNQTSLERPHAVEVERVEVAESVDPAARPLKPGSAALPVPVVKSSPEETLCDEAYEAKQKVLAEREEEIAYRSAHLFEIYQAHTLSP